MELAWTGNDGATGIVEDLDVDSVPPSKLPINGARKFHTERDDVPTGKGPGGANGRLAGTHGPEDVSSLPILEQSMLLREMVATAITAGAIATADARRARAHAASCRVEARLLVEQSRALRRARPRRSDVGSPVA
jgi:hypothetical protein